MTEYIGLSVHQVLSKEMLEKLGWKYEKDQDKLLVYTRGEYTAILSKRYKTNKYGEVYQVQEIF